MYEELFWSLNSALGNCLPVYLLIILILDWLRSILFYQR